MISPERFQAFKAAVAALEFTTDSAELDRHLGEISILLYDVRHEIDDEWREARKASSKIRYRTSVPLSDMELESILDIIRGKIG